MNCSSCNKKISKDSIFCEFCGTSIELRTPKKNNTLKNIIIGVLVVFVVLAIIGSNSDSASNSVIPSANDKTVDKGREAFTSVEHRFKVDFPQYPSTERIEPKKLENGVTYSGTQYVATNVEEDELYLAQTADYDVAPADYDNKAGLEGMLNGFTRGEGMKINFSEFTTFKGYDALEFTGSYSVSGETFYTKGIGIVRDDLDEIKAYIFWVSTKSQTGYMNKYQEFINSLEILN